MADLSAFSRLRARWLLAACFGTLATFFTVAELIAPVENANSSAFEAFAGSLTYLLTGGMLLLFSRRAG